MCGTAMPTSAGGDAKAQRTSRPLRTHGMGLGRHCRTARTIRSKRIHLSKSVGRLQYGCVPPVSNYFLYA